MSDTKFTAEQKQKAIDTMLDLAGHLGISINEVAAMIDVLAAEYTGNPGIRGAAAGRSLRKSIKKLSHRRETE